MELEERKTERTDRSTTPPPSAQSDSSILESSGRALPTGPPNGGWRAWLQVFGSFLILSSAWGLVLSFGALQSFYQFDLLQGYSASSIAWIGAIQSFLLVFTGIWTGPVYDMGYHQTLLLTGGFLTVFGMMMLSLCTEYYQILLAQGICVGLGSGIAYVPSLALVAASFSTRRPIAIALVNSGISVGGIAYLLIFQHLIEPLGFAWTIRIMGFLSLGTFMLGTPMLLCRRVGASRRRRAFVDSTARKDIPFLILCAGGFFRFLGYFSPVFFLPLFAQTSLGLSQSKAVDLLLIFSGSSFCGRLIGSLIAQRTVMLPWMGCSLAAGIICLVWPAVHTYRGAITFAVLYGFTSGPLTVFSPVVVPQFCPSMSLLGTRLGMVWAVTAFAFLIGSPIGAGVADPLHGHFLGLQLFCGCSSLVGAALLLPIWNKVQKK